MIALLWWGCTPPTPLPPGDAELGQALHMRDCALCHGNQAEGTSRGPALEAMDQVGAIDAIRFGQGDMPPFDWTDDDLANWWTWLDTRVP